MIVSEDDSDGTSHPHPPRAGGGGTSGHLPRPPAYNEDSAGDEIGPYRLISQLGEGGFGTVWLAERRRPFVQRVAIKIIKPGMDSRSVIARFEQERQALALMNHPSIARVLDGGLTPHGRPYFAMEFVRGEPLIEFCDARKLGLRARLKLFVQVCEAIHHAHLKSVVHRDLKPANILAFEVEGEAPRLKVIDFGVAKAMSQPMTDKTIFTETGVMIGTPAYMSPEQADPTAGEIDSRSDIYSLGVLLYELVTGATPFEAKSLRSKAYGEIQRIIREEDPPSPSARLSTISSGDAELAGRIERARGIAIDELARELRSELEWIPLKAMRKEPALRYQTAIHLAEDVQSYLAGRPLVAAPESQAYRARKWLRRNRTGVQAAAIGLAAMAIGISIPLLNRRPDEVRGAEASDGAAQMQPNDAGDVAANPPGAAPAAASAPSAATMEVLAHAPDPTVVTDAGARGRIEATGKPWKVRHVASGIVLLLVPPGEFMMGAPEGEPDRKDDEMRHPRAIRKPFYLAQTEVTRDQWRAVTGTDPSYFTDPGFPVDSVSWQTIKDSFVRATNGELRLPTEAEWEYACRAGTSTTYAFGPTIGKSQVCFGQDHPAACGSLPPNPWGFHEMHGNMWEWVEDAYSAFPASGGTEAAFVNPADRGRMLRGGAWNRGIYDCRSACRAASPKADAGNNLGFRAAANAD